MSFLECPHCEERIDVFSTGGGRRTAGAMGVNFLGALPLDPHVRIGGDTGHPIAIFGAEDKRAKGYYEIADAVIRQAAEAASMTGPKITISD
jgi:ATP-binding protein involved in chromosome partitioning